MREHLHSDVQAVIFTTVAVAVGFNLVRMGAAWLTNHGAPAFGNAIGGFFTFGGQS